MSKRLFEHWRKFYVLAIRVPTYVEYTSKMNNPTIQKYSYDFMVRFAHPTRWKLC